uniref:Uncharacterized protein n=1 Tax=Rhabditophanes sp. KR3021 TaxID=114890 RepID=A0AC35TT52_9BILA
MAQTSFYTGAAPQFAFLGTKGGFAGYPTQSRSFSSACPPTAVLCAPGTQAYCPPGTTQACCSPSAEFCTQTGAAYCTQSGQSFFCPTTRATTTSTPCEPQFLTAICETPVKSFYAGAAPQFNSLGFNGFAGYPAF